MNIKRVSNQGKVNMIEKFLDIDTPSCDKYIIVDALLLGGGRAGINILQIFGLYDWLHLDGVVDQDESAPGMQLASALGVPTFINVTVALQQFEGDLVVDATGDSAVSSEVMLYCSRMGKEYISGMVTTHPHQQNTAFPTTPFE